MEQFRQTILEYYEKRGRHDLPWRQFEADGTLDGYKVLVSELMLQQTQVPRVIPKFEAFLRRFPTIQSLAAAPLADVLREWSGLGYNRRAKFLRQAAGMIAHEYDGVLPDMSAELVKLPGVGMNTAGALLAYTYNKPVIFIETNVRTVFIHHFFAGKEQVSDKDIVDLVAKTLPDNPRVWYWALMDYGTHLKQTIGNVSKQSRHHTKQSAFHGSRRQVRGQVLRVLATNTRAYADLERLVIDVRLKSVLDDLVSEGLITKNNQQYALADS